MLGDVQHIYKIWYRKKEYGMIFCQQSTIWQEIYIDPRNENF